MARPRSQTIDFLAYAALRVVVCVAQAVSWQFAISCARLLAYVAYRVDRRHRTVAQENIRHAFPDLDAAAVDRLVLKSYEHLFEMGVEIIRLPRMLHLSNVTEHFHYVKPGEFERAVAFAKMKKPRIVLTGHFGNWEVLSYATGLLGHRGNLVARKIDNPYIHDFIDTFRRKTGQRILDKNADYQVILDTLANNAAVGMVGDQDAGPRGLFVPFMGRPASTYKSIALLSLEYNAPIFVWFAARIGHPVQYRVYVEDIIDPADLAADPDPVRTITRRYTEAIERVVKRHPEQYFWVHRRWKNQPKPTKTKNAA